MKAAAAAAAADRAGGLTSLCLSQPPGQTSNANQNAMVPKRAVYLAALIAFKRSQCAVSEFNVEHGDIATVAHSSTGQSVALLLLQRRHLATVPTTRTDALCCKPRTPVAFQ